MDSSAGLGFRHTLYAVRAALVLHPGVRACSVDQKCCVFKAADSVFIGAGQLCFPAAALCVFDVHTADFCGKECRLVSTGTCAELHDNVLVIVRVFRQKQDFELLLQEELVSYHFQPIYSARSGRIAAYEALMRVDLPTLHSPAQVMQLAHETGRLYEIERITVFHSSAIFQRMQAQGLFQSDALLFINSIANVSLTNEDVEEYAQRYPELLKRLVVEITEQEDLDRACLERKRNVPGFSGSFALDDYGSGYSNELNLLELSPRYIKIDISIVRGIDTDRDKQQIVSNIVAYAHARSMQLIAEGIETEAQLRTVIGLGVDLLQGYYLSRPAAVPAPIAPAAQAVIDQLEHQRFDPLGL